MATSLVTPFGGYDNFVLENVIKSSLNTVLDTSRLYTADYSLAEAPGMVKKIHRYVVDPDKSSVEDLGRGESNTVVINAKMEEFEYRVGRTQGQIIYADDDIMTDSAFVDAQLQFLTEGMKNNWDKKAIAEYAKTENIVATTGYDLENFANVLSRYTEEFENTEGLFWLANIKLDAKIRKMLGDNLIYIQNYIERGAIGSVLGCPLYLSKIVPEGLIFLAKKDAVKAFVKKDVGVEQTRDIDAHTNKVVASRYAVIALVDPKKCIASGAAQGTPATITTATKATTTVAGAATTGAYVECFVNGVEVGHATASSSEYSISTGTTTLAVGDLVKVIAHLNGKVNSVATFTVAD